MSNDNIDKIRSKALRLAHETPFGNSHTQNEYFVIYASLTPARARRAILLKLIGRLNDLKEFDFNLDKLSINIENWKKIKKSWFKSKTSKLLADIELKRASFNYEYELKLAKDASDEVEWLWNELTKYPEYTRDQFEAEEKAHFELMMTRKMSLPVGKEGAAESLLNLISDKDNFEHNLSLPIGQTDGLTTNSFNQNCKQHNDFNDTIKSNENQYLQMLCGRNWKGELGVKRYAES